MRQTRKQITITYIVLTIISILLDLTLAYKQYSLDSPDVCSPNSKRRLKLSTGSKSSIHLTQKLLSNHVLEWRTDSLCKFEIKIDRGAYQRGGIFAVIQNLVLRKNEETGECIDYVQFKLQDGFTSKRFCGIFNAELAMDEIFNRNEFDKVAVQNSFVDRFGELDVYVFIAKEPLLPHEETDISIVFTAYKPCSRKNSQDKPCDEDAHGDVCIYDQFFNDGFYNCPYLNCVDENGCTKYDNDDDLLHHNSYGNKVLIGSVASLLLTFGLFICCIYICRKYGKFCWAEEFVRPVSITNDLPTTSRVIPMTEQVTTEQVVTVPTAPDIESQGDKDLPPSYDSLFPSR